MKRRVNVLQSTPRPLPISCIRRELPRRVLLARYVLQNSFQYFHSPQSSNVRILLRLQGKIILSLGSPLTIFVCSIVDSEFLDVLECALPVLNVVVFVAAFFHNRNFWKKKAKVPFVDDFNEGFEMSKQVGELMVSLGSMWAVAGVLRWVGDQGFTSRIIGFCEHSIRPCTPDWSRWGCFRQDLDLTGERLAS